LQPYKHYLERLFENARYQLSEEEEKIVNLKSKTSHSNWVDMTSRFISREEREVLNEDGKKKKMNFSGLQDLLTSQKKSVRDGAAKEIHDINEKYADVAEAEMNSIMENKKYEDELRGFERPDSSRHVADDIDSDVVDAMVEAVSGKFAVARKYYKLKSELMGVDKLKYHERNVPFGKVPGKYSFEKSIKLVSDVFEDLDEEFAKILKYFDVEGHFDVFPRKGKSGGAFCARYLKVSPVYILLNHSGRVNDVLTLAHEVGHGINDEMMRKSQNALNYGSPLSIAEVASTFFEDFVTARLLEDATEDVRLMLMMEKLNDDAGSIFRQTAAYMFEQELHEEFREKGYLSKDEIGKIFRKHMRAYMGRYVSQDPGSENWWVYWGHFRRFFYVYSYSSGLLISKSLQSMVREDRGNIEKVKDILSAGRSASPVEIFKSAGIDIKDRDFWNRGLAENEQLLKDTEKLAREMGKI
jgi:oligoendopeptidase F